MSVSRHDVYRRPSIRLTRLTSGLPKVVIIHDHAVISEALQLAFGGRIEVVGTTRAGVAGVALSELYVPDVVVVGEMLIDGVSEYYAPALLRIGARVLLLTETSDMSRMLAMVELGITGILESEQTPQDVVEAVLTLSSGGAVLPADLVAGIVNEWRRRRHNPDDGSTGVELTSRELEVLDAMSDGLSTKAVAHHLGIASKTVENHKTRIFHKLGVRTQAEAVVKALGNANLPVALGDAPASSQ